MSEPREAPLGVVIVEDEERARRILRGVIERDPALIVLAETAGREAPAVIARARPLILLLDVQMPGMDGFAVLRELGDGVPPIVIFVTAYDEYALEAFDVAAIDYVLKPFTDERLRTALERAKSRARGAGLQASADAVRRLLEHLGAAVPASPRRLVLRDGGRTLLVDPQSIDWVEAEGVYVRLHMLDGNVLVRESLTQLATRLEPHGFIRIHRSVLVNIGRIEEIVLRSHGDGSVRLRGGTDLTVTRTRRAALEDRLRELS
ncbi:MAG TPA: LytTR family DNA-binding domain-containing protein [Longimicrobiales bacterium]|nr:LytTR family DNA-binding domain-containing protein [Longimicrobiales bacterium]